MSLTTAMPAPPPRTKEAGANHPAIDATVTEYTQCIDNGINSLLPHPPTTANIIDVLSAAAQHCAGPKALNFRRLNVEFASVNNKNSKKKLPTAMNCPPEDEWEFVDFERVFSKTPGLGGVLENCEIQFRSAPDSPVQPLVDYNLNNVPKLNDHPFEFRSKEASRNNTAPGTPNPPSGVLRVPSIPKATAGVANHEAPARLADATVLSPVASTPPRRRTISGRELDLATPPQQACQPRRRNTSTSSTLSEFDGDDKKNAKLEKNRQSARDCRKRKKEYINSLELQGQEIQVSMDNLRAQIEDRDEIIGELLRALLKANPHYVQSDKVRAWNMSTISSEVVVAAIQAPQKRKAKNQGGDGNAKRTKSVA